jgi:hypothetical protein
VERFNREGPISTGLPGALDAATEELRATIERQTRQIVEAAEARARAIEETALRRASQRDHDSRRRARQILDGAHQRSAGILESLDGFEEQVARSLAALRSDAEALVDEIAAELPSEFVPPGDDFGIRIRRRDPSDSDDG